MNMNAADGEQWGTRTTQRGVRPQPKSLSSFWWPKSDTNHPISPNRGKISPCKHIQTYVSAWECANNGHTSGAHDRNAADAANLHFYVLIPMQTKELTNPRIYKMDTGPLEYELLLTNTHLWGYARIKFSPLNWRLSAVGHSDQRVG